MRISEFSAGQSVGMRELASLLLTACLLAIAGPVIALADVRTHVDAEQIYDSTSHDYHAAVTTDRSHPHDGEDGHDTVYDGATYSCTGLVGTLAEPDWRNATKGGGKSARTPVGRSGQQNHFPNPNAPKPRNAPETIGGRDYSGHAIDRMQERGYTPSVIENALRTGTRSAGNKPSTSVFTDSTNNLRVITNSETGRVITVIPGGG